MRDEDAKVGGRTRDLLRAFTSFMDMLAVDAPTPVLARQMDELEAIAKEIDALAGTSLFESDVFTRLGDSGKLMRLYELFQYRQARDSESGSE